MALVKRRMSRKKTFILLGTLVVAALGGLYYIFGTGTSTVDGGTETDAVTQRLRTELREVNTVGNALLPTLEDLFNDVRYRELRQFADVPVEQGKTGRPNPFLPF